MMTMQGRLSRRRYSHVVRLDDVELCLTHDACMLQAGSTFAFLLNNQLLICLDTPMKD